MGKLLAKYLPSYCNRLDNARNTSRDIITMIKTRLGPSLGPSPCLIFLNSDQFKIDCCSNRIRITREWREQRLHWMKYKRDEIAMGLTRFLEQNEIGTRKNENWDVEKLHDAEKGTLLACLFSKDQAVTLTRRVGFEPEAHCMDYGFTDRATRTRQKRSLKWLKKEEADCASLLMESWRRLSWQRSSCPHTHSLTHTDTLQAGVVSNHLALCHLYQHCCKQTPLTHLLFFFASPLHVTPSLYPPPLTRPPLFSLSIFSPPASD